MASQAAEAPVLELKPRAAPLLSDPQFPVPGLRPRADVPRWGDGDTRAMDAKVDTLVVTCGVPCKRLDELVVTVLDHTVAVAGPEGFAHELELPAEADMSALTVELYKGFLELRAPCLSRVVGGAR